MSSTFTKSIVGTLAAVIALGGVMTGAQAGGNHNRHLKFQFSDGPHDPCAFYFHKWKTTGKFKWKQRYIFCISTH
ncbi:MAG: hypothetical protein ACT4N2_00475 [Hyphomicrobium sp.]